VLVVEDNLDAVHSMAMLLKTMGHECKFATDGFAAIHIARMFRPHVVLLDIGLAGFKGDVVAKQLRWKPGLEHTRRHERKFAINGFAAIHIARPSRPHVVLLDTGLPDFKGDVIAKPPRWESGLEHTRIIAITRLPNDDEIRQRALEAGCEDFYKKPLDPVTLEELLAKPLAPMNDIYASAISKAVAECGGEGVLAERLDVPIDEVRSWMQGSAVPSLGKVFIALVLADGRDVHG
jgi:DNA-binding response OmpR family regulator